MECELIRKTSKRLEPVIKEVKQEELSKMIDFTMEIQRAFESVIIYPIAPIKKRYKKEMIIVIRGDEGDVIVGVEYKGQVYDCIKVEGKEVEQRMDKKMETLDCAFVIFDLISNYSHLMENAKDSDMWRVMCKFMARLAYSKYESKKPKQVSEYKARKNN